MIAMLPDQDLGIAVLWNGESSVPTGLLPTMIDRAVGIPSSATAWLDIDFNQHAWYAENGRNAPGSSAAEATAAPR